MTCSKANNAEGGALLRFHGFAYTFVFWYCTCFLLSSIGNSNRLDQHIPIDLDYPGLQQLHSSPDIYLVKGFLEDGFCDSIVNNAASKGLEESPVAYAGWTKV